MTVQMALEDGLTIARRNLIKIKRVPDLLVFTTLSPIMFVLLFAYVFGSAISVPGHVVSRIPDRRNLHADGHIRCHLDWFGDGRRHSERNHRQISIAAHGSVCRADRPNIE